MVFTTMLRHLQAATLNPEMSCREWFQEYFPSTLLVTGVLIVLFRLGEVVLARFYSPEGRLRRAIFQGDIYPWYQPVICARTGVTGGAEVLARRRLHDGGVGMPGTFITLAEQSQLLVPLMCSLTEQVTRDMAQTFLPRGFRLSVNLSASCLADKTLVKNCRRLHSELMRQQAALTLELTERECLENTPYLLRQLSVLRMEGMHIALDDFGTGFSGLSALAAMPVDYLKLDAVFTERAGICQGPEPDDRHLLIIRHLKVLANALGSMVVAEGVENARQRDWLLKEGVNWQQGYLHARPMSAERFQAWMYDRKGEVVPVAPMLRMVPCRVVSNKS